MWWTYTRTHSVTDGRQVTQYLHRSLSNGKGNNLTAFCFILTYKEFHTRKIYKHTLMLGGSSSLHLKNRFRWPIVILAGQNRNRRSLTCKSQPKHRQSNVQHNTLNRFDFIFLILTALDNTKIANIKSTKSFKLQNCHQFHSQHFVSSRYRIFTNHCIFIKVVTCNCVQKASHTLNAAHNRSFGRFLQCTDTYTAGKF